MKKSNFWRLLLATAVAVEASNESADLFRGPMRSFCEEQCTRMTAPFAFENRPFEKSMPAQTHFVSKNNEKVRLYGARRTICERLRLPRDHDGDEGKGSE